MGKKIPDIIFIKTFDHVFGQLVQLETQFELHDDFDTIEYLVFGNLSPDGLRRVCFSIDWSSPKKTFVLEGKDVDMVLDLLSIDGKMFQKKFKMWFFQKFPSFQSFEYSFIQTFPLD